MAPIKRERPVPSTSGAERTVPAVVTIRTQGLADRKKSVAPEVERDAGYLHEEDGMKIVLPAAVPMIAGARKRNNVTTVYVENQNPSTARRQIGGAR